VFRWSGGNAFDVQIVDYRRLSLTEQRSMAKQPKSPFHPGEILLEEFLEPLGISQAAFAEKIGWTKARLNELRGKRGVTAEAALDLAEVLGTSPKIWMNFQATYDLDRAKRARAA
jgi:antitoxin HigA-1